LVFGEQGVGFVLARHGEQQPDGHGQHGKHAKAPGEPRPQLAEALEERAACALGSGKLPRRFALQQATSGRVQLQRGACLVATLLRRGVQQLFNRAFRFVSHILS
jgi:hypothetical protein